MRRILAIALGLLLVGGYVITTAASSRAPSAPNFYVHLDNAFGLVNGSDFKVAGVRAGKITSIKLDRKTLQAVVGVQVNETGFGSFRTDTTCDSRPQSLIGEYFLSCDPGHNPQELASGATIPVTQTTSTIPPDLVQDILRKPYDQRLSLLINELGAGVAGRGADLNAALQRAVPALQQTDRVLAILAHQNQVLKDLTQNGDSVVHALAAGKDQVGRFVVSSAHIASLTAQQRTALQATLHRLPAFFRELGPTMAALGDAAVANTPALQDLQNNATQLRRLFDNLGPLANAGRPAFKALSNTADTGRQAIKAAGPTIALLNTLSTNVPELSQNLRIILQHLDNRQNAVEPNPQSPGGAGYTGLEGILNYVFDQVMAVNIHDANHYILKINLFLDNDCSPYADAATVNKASPAVVAKCNSWLGPTHPNLLGQPDFNDQAPGFLSLIHI